ncbi:hypothetical protein OG592_37115 [Streptomyces avidinii]|uniref:hypothetical protein n=1 Tax=Streptomyces avidinii TaxID=1895 RepID=UPI0038657CE4|nr:hypothetical protein OG592_37115 [Streptomyces avidinii]
MAGKPFSSKEPTQIVALDLETGATKWTQPADPITTPRFLGADADGVYVLGGKASQDMNVNAYAAKDGAKTQISSVKAPDEALAMPSLVVEYNAGNLALIEPGRGTFGTLMFRAPTP